MTAQFAKSCNDSCTAILAEHMRLRARWIRIERFEAQLQLQPAPRPNLTMLKPWRDIFVLFFWWTSVGRNSPISSLSEWAFNVCPWFLRLNPATKPIAFSTDLFGVRSDQCTLARRMFHLVVWTIFWRCRLTLETQQVLSDRAQPARFSGCSGEPARNVRSDCFVCEQRAGERLIHYYSFHPGDSVVLIMSKFKLDEGMFKWLLLSLITLLTWPFRLFPVRLFSLHGNVSSLGVSAALPLSSPVSELSVGTPSGRKGLVSSWHSHIQYRSLNTTAKLLHRWPYWVLPAQSTANFSAFRVRIKKALVPDYRFPCQRNWCSLTPSYSTKGSLIICID